MTLVQIRPIISADRIPSVEALYHKIDQAMADEALLVKQLYDSTTRSWRRRPTFVVRVEADRPRRTVYTQSDIYRYVDEGTRPHRIRVRRARMLRFAVGGRPKTTPGSLSSGPGRAGHVVLYRREVQHPGSRAREFSKMITSLSQTSIRQRMSRVFEGIARDAGSR